MRAVRWHGPRTVGVDTIDDPRIEEPTDAIIRVTSTGICGSDLHLYEHGASLGVLPGDVLGHEPLGVVEEVGAQVTHVAPGDKVVVPFNISCGRCYFCRRQLYSQCELTQNVGGRKGAALFGYTHLYGGVAGAQAQFLRVPQAHFGPIRLDGEIPDDAALLLSDVLPTAWQAVVYADTPPDGTLAVFGLGPIGQMCVRIARHRGVENVIGIDGVPARLNLAAEHGAAVIDYRQTEPTAAVHDLTDGRGADSVIDAVGLDADSGFLERVLQAAKLVPDRLNALHQSLASVRRGGTASIVGVYAGWAPMFPIGDLFDKQIQLRWGQANVRRWTDEIVDVLRAGDPIDAGSLVTHKPSLEEAGQWYQRFRDKEEDNDGSGIVKVALQP